MKETRSTVNAAGWKRVLLAAVTALLAFATLGVWAIASPVGASPDEDYHLASIWCSWGERDGLCAAGDEANERTVPDRLLSSSACFAQNYAQSAQCPLDDEKTRSTDRGNFVGAYPPIFYSVMGVFAGPDIALSTVLMRLFNVATFVGVITAVLSLLRPGQRGPMIWGSVVTLVPLGVFIVASVNPSTWAILGGLTVWLATYGYFTAETRARRIALGAIAAVTGIMAAGARGDSAVFVAFSALVAIILSYEHSARWRRLALLPLGIILVGAGFFLTSGQSTDIASSGVAQSGAAASANAATTAAEVAEPSKLGMLLSNLLDLPWLWTGSTGTWGLGWYDTAMPNSVWVVMLFALGAMVFWGLSRMDWRKGLVLALSALALTVIPLYVLYGKAVRVGEWVQPRYLLPLLIILVCVSLFGFGRDHLRISRLQAAVLFFVITFANSYALNINMRRYISGLGDDSGFNLNENIEWWWNIPVSPMTVWFAGSAAFGLMLVGLWLWLYPKGERPGAGIEERSPELVGK